MKTNTDSTSVQDSDSNSNSGLLNRTAQSREIKMTPEEIIHSAYNAFGLSTIVKAPLPQGEYDFICNLPQGASNALQNALAAKFALTASRQTVKTNVLALSVHDIKAVALPQIKHPRLHSYMRGHFFMANQPIKTFADEIERYFGQPVIDQTGLTGKVSIDLFWNAPRRGTPPSLERYNQTLIDELGLELTPDVQPVPMFVIEKAK